VPPTRPHNKDFRCINILRFVDYVEREREKIPYVMTNIAIETFL